MNKYRVQWTETIDKEATVDAVDETEAYDLVMNGNEPETVLNHGIQTTNVQPIMDVEPPASPGADGFERAIRFVETLPFQNETDKFFVLHMLEGEAKKELVSNPAEKGVESGENTKPIISVAFANPLGWLRENLEDMWPDRVSSMGRTDLDWNASVVCSVTDEEEGERFAKRLTADDLVNALRKLCELVDAKKLFVGGVRSSQDLDDAGYWDVEVVDAYWQIAYHGEVIYG